MKPHLCHVFPAFATGGPEVRTALLINAFNGRFRHTVISLDGNLSGRSRIQTGEVCFLEAPHTGRRLGHALVLTQMLREIRPDLVLTYGWGGTDGVLAARLIGIHRVIHGEDGFHPEEAHGQIFHRLMARRILFCAAARIVCPSYTLVRIARQEWGLPGNQISFIPNGVDTNRFAPVSASSAAAIREQLGIRPSETVIGTVGHLRAEKNQERLLHAFASLSRERETRLFLLGEGPLRNSLTQCAAKLGVTDRVVFTGSVTDPVTHYRAMNIFALSSDTEQMPLSLLEAMGIGLPVVSTAVGDVAHMISSPNAPYVTPLGDETAYVQALRELVDRADLRDSLGRANRHKCLQEYEQASMIETYRRLYEDALAMRA